MSLRARLWTMERVAARAGLLTGEAPCAFCRGPDPSGREVVIVDLADSEAPPRCPACERPLDEQGQPVSPRAMVIYLHDDGSLVELLPADE